jgi:hypothetical protein
MEDAVAIAVEITAGGYIVVALGALWKRSARHRGIKGSCGETRKRKGGVGAFHLARAGSYCLEWMANYW